MELNELLTSTRAVYLRAYLAGLESSVVRSIEELFAKADNSYSSSEQGQYLSARTLLQEHSPQLPKRFSEAMETLLNRSFQTTYNKFRPSAAAMFNADSLSLIDANAFEDELKIDDITKRYRTEAEEQLRDLNIRIALIFEQSEISEREIHFAHISWLVAFQMYWKSLAQERSCTASCSTNSLKLSPVMLNRFIPR